jgi:hypothetical protein
LLSTLLSLELRFESLELRLLLLKIESVSK